MTLEATPANSVEEVAGEISVTKTDDLLMCEAKFKYRYVLGLKRPKSYALAFGTAFDRGADGYFNETKRAKRPSTAEVKEMVRYALGEELAAAEPVSAADETRSELIDQGIGLAGMWEQHLARHLEPIAVQEAFRVDLGPSVPFKVTGVLDLAAKPVPGPHTAFLEALGARGPFFSDTKTSKTSWSKGRAQASLQPPIYTLGARVTLGLKDVDQFQFHVIRKHKEPKPPQVLLRTVDESDIKLALKTMELANRSIRSKWVDGSWTPNRASHLCSRKYCSFWRECERDYGGTVSGAEEV